MAPVDEIQVDRMSICKKYIATTCLMKNELCISFLIFLSGYKIDILSCRTSL